MENVMVDVQGNVTGTFRYVKGYEGFNSTVPTEQEGYFFPFVIGKNGATMSFVKNGVPVKENIPWEAPNVFRITKTDTFEIKVDQEHLVTLSFANAEFEPKG